MVIDAHLDLAFNAVSMDADLTLPLAALRATPYGRAAIAAGETSLVALPELRAADVRLAFGTVFVQSPSQTFHLTGPTYSTPAEANAQGWAQLRYYHALEARGEVRLVRDRSDLEHALTGALPLPALVPLMEGADPIRDIDELAEWRAAGLRIVGLAWSATRFCGGTGMPGPLTPLGRELVPALAEHGFALDTSHLAEESFWQALDRFQGPVLASHSNCRAFVPTDRQLSDDMIRAIVERDGVIGVVPYNKFLDPQWMPKSGKTVPIEAVVRHIEHICELAGNTRHVGIGSDFDGGFGVESLPSSIHSVADLHLIGHALREKGWSTADVDAVLHENWARWLHTLFC